MCTSVVATYASKGVEGTRQESVCGNTRDMHGMGFQNVYHIDRKSDIPSWLPLHL